MCNSLGHTEPVKGSYRLALSYTGIHHTTQSSQLGPIIHRAVHQALSILEEVKGVSMAGVGWRLASSMGSACRRAMSSRGERAHTASQRAGERAVRSGACGEDGGAWAAGAPGSRASSAASRASAPRRGAAAWACCERACQAAPDCASSCTSCDILRVRR